NFVRNNPVNLIDPTGRLDHDPGSTGGERKGLFRRMGSWFRVDPGMESGDPWFSGGSNELNEVDVVAQKEGGAIDWLVRKISFAKGKGITMLGTGTDGFSTWNQDLHSFSIIDMTSDFWNSFTIFGRKPY